MPYTLHIAWAPRAIFATAALISIALQATEIPAFAQAQMPPLMDRQNETALALSACPPAVAEKAGVYVLDAAGYARVRDSQNGFNAIVQHSLPTSVEPRCMDAEGTRTHLPRILKVAELRALGKTRDEIQNAVADAYAKGAFQPPARVGIDYMLSPENRVPNEKGEVISFPPHIMIYAPYLTNAAIGVDRTNLGADGNPTGPVFVAGEGAPGALIIIPVPTDGGSHQHPGGTR